MKALVVDLGQQHVILIDAGIAGQDLAEFPYIGRLIHAHADLDLSRLLRRVENVHVEIHLAMVLRHRHRHTQERVEGVGLPVTPRTGQTGSELRLEHGMDEGIVAPHVIRQGLGGDDVVGSTERILQSKMKKLN